MRWPVITPVAAGRLTVNAAIVPAGVKINCRVAASTVTVSPVRLVLTTVLPAPNSTIGILPLCTPEEPILVSAGTVSIPVIAGPAGMVLVQTPLTVVKQYEAPPIIGISGAK